ncbi:MAG: hypothetical protein KDD84_19430 [Caldilineaceae bacterium]|nr:hypothetical protein [Caldilineaceae bacterium]
MSGSRFEAAFNAVVQAKHNLLAARDLLQNQRQLVTEQISALVRELRYKLASHPFACQREIMRTYGLRFDADGKDETGDAPAGNMALTTQTGARPLGVAA